MTDNEAILKQRIENIQDELNLLLAENRLMADIDTYECGSIERGNYSRVNIKIYKEL